MTRIALTLAVALVPVAGFPAGATAALRLSGSERELIRLVNEERAQYGLGRLRASGGLRRAADRHSRDMLRRDFFGHNSSDGTPFQSRVRRYASGRQFGETLAFLGQRRGGEATIVRMWMASPPHRAIVLGSGFRRIGIARRWGSMGGSNQAVVTADFASRR